MTPAATAQRLEPQAWMTAPETKAVVAALRAKGAEVRFVGGCVRDALAGRGVKDVDLATPDRPEQVIELLQAAGLKAVPTGLDHGTVTAIAGQRPFEITTLREDVETDGRRAKVAFTDDWQVDAARRDLTFNAMSCSPEGDFFDPFGGRADLAAGRVRFVGDARERIREDYLRLLRFFRFQAHFGKVPPDAATLAILREAAPHLETLSGERLRSELLRLLEASDPLPVLEIMVADEILSAVLPELAGTAALGALLELDLEESDDPLLRLGALLMPGVEVAEEAAARLRLSNAERNELVMLADPQQVLGESAAVLTKGYGDPVVGHGLAIALYRAGPARLRRALAMAYARLAAADPAAEQSAGAGLESALAIASAWQPRSFPLTGGDVLDLGITSGPDVGSLLRAVEDWWLDEDFRPGREACLARLHELTARISPALPTAPGV